MNKIYKLAGDINSRGEYDLSSEKTFKNILINEAGGMKEYKNIKMIQIGGPLGECLTGNQINNTLSDFEQVILTPSIYFFNDLFCPVDYLRFITRYMIREVKHDTKRIRDINMHIENIAQGNSELYDFERIKMMIKMEVDTLADELFDKVFETIIKKFESEILEHITDKKCHNGICRGLIISQCINACPAEINIPGYVELMKNDRHNEAYALMRQENPLSFICGKVCARPCEERCRRKEIESTVGVRALQRFAAGKALDIDEFIEDKLPSKNKSIGIVGAGPCGLSSAYYLARTGYEVTIYEAEKHVGGMLAFGVPSYRLPYEDIVKEVKIIEKLGVKIKTGIKIGEDISFNNLKKNHHAVLLATGSHVGNKLPGFSSPKIETAIGFLRSVRLENRRKTYEKVLVVGGGDVAIDAARTSLRLGAKNVYIMSLESFYNMPASIEERMQAKEEKIEFIDGHGIRDLKFNSKINVDYVKCIQVFDDDGNFSPKYDNNNSKNMEVDSLIFAIGQKPNLEYLDDNIDKNRGFVSVKKNTFQTNDPKIFAAGDITRPSIAVEAIANGKKAASSIDKYLGGSGLYTGSEIEIPETNLNITTWDDPLTEEKLLSPKERILSFNEVSLGYTNEEAKLEATRCMRCDRNSSKPLLLKPFKNHV